MKKAHFVSVFLFFCGAICFCGGRNEISFEKIEKKYPSNEYFYAFGEGATLDNAESSAKLGICQILGEAISGEQKTFQSDSSSGERKSSLSTDVSETVSFSNVAGIEIKETRRIKGGDWFCVAVLNKKNAWNYYSALAKKNGAEVQNMLLKAMMTEGSFDAVEFAENAVFLAQENQVNLDLLSAIDFPQSKIFVVPYGSLEKVKIAAKKISGSVKVKINVRGDRQNRIKDALHEFYSKRGISTVEAGENYFVDAVFTAEEIPSLDGINTFVRYTFSAPLAEAASKNIVRPFSMSGREGHISLDTAESRCVSKVVSALLE